MAFLQGVHKVGHKRLGNDYRTVSIFFTFLYRENGGDKETYHAFVVLDADDS